MDLLTIWGALRQMDGHMQRMDNTFGNIYDVQREDYPPYTSTGHIYVTQDTLPVVYCNSFLY